jgi:hypothetical protein
MTKPDLHAITRRIQTLSVFFLAAFIATPALAQGASNGTHGSIGDVYVRSIGGGELRGQLLRLGPDTLTLLEQGSSHDIRLTDVTRIEARGDSVKDGAIIGAAVLAGWCAVICPQGLDGYSGRDFGYILAVNTALGALIGAGIDGMHVGRTTIYQPADIAAGRKPSGVKAFLSKRFRF